MGLMDVFKPDWKHGTPERRKLAVAKIENPETFAEMLANEQVQSVKDAIYKKHATIETLQRLIPLVNGSDKAFLENKLHLLQFNASLNATELSKAYLQELDAKELSRLARDAKSVDVQLKAVELIDHVTMLSAIIQNTEKHVAKVAIEKLSDKETLQKLMKSVRQKGIRLELRKRYDVLFGEEERAKERKFQGLAQLENVLTVLEDMTNESDWSALSDGFAIQLDRWQQFSEFSSEAHNRKFQDLCEECQVRKTEYENMAAEKAATGAAIEARLQTRHLILHALLEATEVLQENGSQLISDFNVRWELMEAAETSEEIALQERFEKTVKTFGVKQNLLRDVQKKKEAVQEELQGILSELTALKESEVSPKLRSTLQERRTILRSLDDSFKKEFSSLFDNCQSVLTELDGKLSECEVEAEKRSIELNKEYEVLIAAVDAIEKFSRGNTQKVKARQARWETMGDLEVKTQEKLNKLFRQSCDRYFGKFKEGVEEREWSEFSNLAAKERLLAETEALEKIEDPVELATKIKEKQAQWKEIGPVPYVKSDEIWTRFKEVSDTLYERCKAYFDEQAGKRQQSLDAKLAFCEEAEALQHSQDWTVVGDKLKELQKQWKEAGNGPRKEDHLAWERFRAACDIFFAARKSHYDERDAARAENTQRKLALVEEIEKWSISEQLREAAQHIKELQTEWKNVGPATRDQDQKLWRRFHKAADEFFANRREQYNKIQESLTENAIVKEALCAQLQEKIDALHDDSDWTALSQSFRQSQIDWRALAGAGIERDQELWKTFKGLCDRFFKARDEFYDKLSDEARVKLDTKEEYCLKIELLVESTEWRETAEELKRLQAEFHALPSVNEKYDRLLYARFHGVCQSFFDRRREHFKEQDDQRQDNLTRKKALCVRLEELAGVTCQGDEEGEKISMEDLAARLQNALAPNLAEETAQPLSFKDASEEVRELQAAWKTIGPVPKVQSQAVWERFRHAADTFYNKRNAFFAERNLDEVETLRKKRSASCQTGSSVGETGLQISRKSSESMAGMW